MPDKHPIATSAAPAAIGTYSQAIKTGNLVFLSGQIPLDPGTMEIVGAGDAKAQIAQVIANLSAVAEAAGGSLDDIVRVTVFLTDLGDFPLVNEAMAAAFSEPYPARAAIEVSGLPKGASVEMDAILAL